MHWKEEKLLPYRLGGLLYTPALNEGIAEKIGTIPDLRALALCLEDSIRDEALPQAEEALVRTLAALKKRTIPCCLYGYGVPGIWSGYTGCWGLRKDC